MTDMFYWAVALLFVIGLILGMAIVLRHFIGPKTTANKGFFRSARQRRLQLIEALPLDHKSRLILIRRDGDVEHLVLQSQTGDLVIERGITPKEEAIISKANEPENPKSG